MLEWKMMGAQARQLWIPFVPQGPMGGPVQDLLMGCHPVSNESFLSLIGDYGCAVSNAGVEDDGGSGTPIVDPFYTPGAYGGSSPGSAYGSSSPGSYTPPPAAMAPSPAASAPGPYMGPAMAPGPLPGSAPAGSSGAAVESAPGSETLICYFGSVGCFSAMLTDAMTQSSTVPLECTSGSSSMIAYTIAVTYPAGTGGWLTVSPSAGSLMTNAATPTK